MLSESARRSQTELPNNLLGNCDVRTKNSCPSSEDQKGSPEFQSDKAGRQKVRFLGKKRRHRQKGRSGQKGSRGEGGGGEGSGDDCHAEADCSRTCRGPRPPKEAGRGGTGRSGNAHHAAP